MSSSRRKTGEKKELLRFLSKPRFRTPSLVIGWDVDAAWLGTKVTDYLNRKLGGQPFCEIEPLDFFSLAGVTIENDLVQFPESTFYACPDKDLVVFRSSPPSYEWYRFLNLVMDVAHDYCHVKELYTVGGMVALGAHTAPRQAWATMGSPEIKNALSSYGLTREITFETPPGGRPTLNSFTLWNAKRRGIPGANVWVPIPFYLVTLDDPRAQKKVLEFLNHRLELQLDFEELDEEIRRQDENIARMRDSDPDIDNSIGKLEGNITLSERESQELVRKVEDFLRTTRD